MVSVIIPTYNTPEALLLRCIRSVLRSRNVELEVILVDDYSSHPLPQFEDMRVRIIRTPRHIGPYNCRRLGLSDAKGDWITFVDADDTLHPDALSEALELSECADIVQMKVINRVSRLKLPLRRGSVLPHRALDAMMFDDTLFPVQMWGKLYRASILKRANLPIYDGFWGEDRLFNIAILELAPRILYAPRARYSYYWSAGATKGAYRSLLQDIKRVQSIKKHYAILLYGNRKEEIWQLIDNESKRFLEHDVRMRMNTGTYSRQWLETELEDRFWKSMLAIDSPTLIERRNRRSIMRRIKRLAFI